MQLSALVAVAVGFPTCFALASWSCHTFTASRGFAELQCPVKVDNRETASKFCSEVGAARDEACRLHGDFSEVCKVHTVAHRSSCELRNHDQQVQQWHFTEGKQTTGPGPAGRKLFGQFGKDDRGHAQNTHLGSITATTLGTFKSEYCEKVLGWDPTATAATTPGSIGWCESQSARGADQQVIYKSDEAHGGHSYSHRRLGKIRYGVFTSNVEITWGGVTFTDRLCACHESWVSISVVWAGDCDGKPSNWGTGPYRPIGNTYCPRHDLPGSSSTKVSGCKWANEWEKKCDFSPDWPLLAS